MVFLGSIALSLTGVRLMSRYCYMKNCCSGYISFIVKVFNICIDCFGGLAFLLIHSI